jgi:hypothetical protein
MRVRINRWIAVAVAAFALLGLGGGIAGIASARHHHHHRGIPQHNGGDHDADNNGGPSDGDGNL